jgi:hypothetical protein
MWMQLPRPLEPVSSLAKNIGQVATATSVDHAGNNMGQGAVAISRIAYMVGMAGMIGKMDGPLSPRDVGLGMAIAILAMEMVLGWVLPWISNQGRGVSSASKIDEARRDYDSLRSFYDTTATGNQLVKHVLKRTNGKDLSDRAFDKVRPAIERCRVA